MRSFNLVIVVCVALSGCAGSESDGYASDDGSTTTPAGSCNFEAAGRCDDYAEPDATANTAAECGSMGGVWSAAQCPLTGRAAVCMANAPATRTFAYGTAGATDLASRCPAEQLIQLEGSCDKPMKSLCDEYSGTRATAGAGEKRCRMETGTWVAGGKCAMEGRSASCKNPSGPTITYAYGFDASDTLDTACEPANFTVLEERPVEMPDEDAGF